MELKRFVLPGKIGQIRKAYFQKYGEWPGLMRSASWGYITPEEQNKVDRWNVFCDRYLADENAAEQDQWDALCSSGQGIVKEEYKHRAEIKPDGTDEVTFKWHWPRGTFDKRMSAYEIASFVLPHMPSILPLLSDWPHVYKEFLALLTRLATWPLQVLDEIMPWIRRLDFNEEDEILLLDLRAKELPSEPIWFVPELVK